MHSRLERCSAIALSASLLGVLAALPASCAGASAAPGTLRAAGQVRADTATTSYTLEGVLSAAQLKQLLSGLPVKSGPLTPAQLASALAHLPGLEGIGIPHLEEALAQSLKGLGSTATLEAALQDPASLSSSVIQAVKGLLSILEAGELLKLEVLLGKPPTQALQEALERVDAGELLHRLMGAGSQGSGKTAEAILQAVPTSTVESVLGSGLGTEPIAEHTVEGLAGELDMTATQLAQAAGETSSELPGSAQALTMPLADGKVMSILDGTEKAVVGTLGEGTTGGGSGDGSGGSGSGGSGAGGAGSGSGSGSGGSGGSGSGGSGSGGSGSGGSGGGPGGSGAAGTGGSGGSATATGPTVLIEMPATGSPEAGAASSSKAGRVKVVSHSVRGGVATIVISVPSAGTLTLRNGDIQRTTRKIAHAGRVSIRVRLSRAGAAAVRRHHRRLQLRVSVSFAPTHGARSSASAALLFK